SLSLSRLPPEAAVTTKCVEVFLMPAALTLSASGTPAGVHDSPARGSAPSAAASVCAAGLDVGFTVAAASRLPAVQAPDGSGTLTQAWSAKVQTPSALPSESQLDPSAQLKLPLVMPDHSTKQSVDPGPPPGKQVPGGQSASAAPPSVVTRTTIAMRITV